jgi:4-amino-4-deoxy-L-arabinose transferase-like glycosyltransferase
MRPLFHWSGPALAALIVLPWFVAIEVATAGGFARDAFFGDMAPKVVSSAEGHGGPPGYHLALLALTFFPATIGLIPGLALAFNAARAPAGDGGGQAGLRFLIAWAAPTWLVFEIVGTKLPHYVLPVFPALALLSGAGLIAAQQRRWRATPALSIALFAIGAAGFAAACAYLMMFAPGNAEAAHQRAWAAGIVGGLALLTTLVALGRFPRAAARTAIAVALALATTWALREYALPRARALFVSAEAADALKRAGLAGAPLVIGFNETSLVFLTRTDARLYPLGEDAFIAVQTAAPGTPVLMDCDFAAMAQMQAWSFKPVGPDIHGVNYANGDHVCLRPGVAGAEMSEEERARFLENASRGPRERTFTAPHP